MNILFYYFVIVTNFSIVILLHFFVLNICFCICQCYVVCNTSKT